MGAGVGRVSARDTDIVHVIEYIWGTARALFGESNAKARAHGYHHSNRIFCRKPISLPQ
jgi:hypothetical protein